MGKAEIATGFVPVCYVTKKGNVVVKSATCRCALGAYENQFRQRRDDDNPNSRRRESFTFEDAKADNLLDPGASTWLEHQRYAREREHALNEERLRREDEERAALLAMEPTFPKPNRRTVDGREPVHA